LAFSGIETCIIEKFTETVHRQSRGTRPRTRSFRNQADIGNVAYRIERYIRSMKRVVLISCVSKKLPHAAPAKELYMSALFQFCLRFARTLKPDNIFILSAKYGLVNLEHGLNLTTTRSMPSATPRSSTGRKVYRCSCVQK